MIFNYFKKFSNEELADYLTAVTEFQAWQSIGLFLSKATWIVILVNSFWGANISTLNKFVFGIMFAEYPFSVYLFKVLNINIGIRYTSLLLGVGIFVYIMTLLFNVVENVIINIETAISDKDNNNMEDDDDE